MNKKLLFSLAGIFICLVDSFSQQFTDSNLPIVVFGTSGQNIDSIFYGTKTIWMGVIDNGPGNRNHINDPYTYSGLTEVDLHGSSTLMFPKKSWNVTTLDTLGNKKDTPLLGLPAEHDWVFKSLYQDKTFLRDELSFMIFNRMGHYASRTRFFELVVNGDYRGVYQVEEKIKRGKYRLDIAKLGLTETTGDNLTGGYIIKLDHLGVTDQGWYSNYVSDYSNNGKNYFIYKYPKPDSMPQEQKDYIHSFFDNFEQVMNSSTWNDPALGYTAYIDPTSFADVFLVEELSRNTDGYRLSTYFYKDKDSKDPRLHAGPVWDYNIAWGNCDSSGGDNPYWWQYQMHYADNYIPFWWQKLLSDKPFQDMLRCRWQTLRSSILAKSYLNSHIDSLTGYLNESQDRNFKRWPILGKPISPQPSPAPADYAGEIAHLKWWIQERLTWLDSYIPGVCVPSANGLAENTELVHVDVFPNPFEKQFKITYSLPFSPVNTQVSLELLNAVGEQVFLSYGEKPAGTHEESIAAAGLPPGIYTLRLNINGSAYTRKLVKLE